MEKIDEIKIHAKKLKELIARNKIDEVIQELLQLTDNSFSQEFHDLVVIQSSRYQDYKKKKLIGATNFEQLEQSKLSVSQSLLEIIENIQQKQIQLKTGFFKKSKGIGKKMFTIKLLIWILIIKFIVIIYFFTIGQSGVFTKEQFISLLASFLPLTAVCVSLFFRQSFSKERMDAKNNINPISRNIQLGVSMFLIGYFLLNILAVNLRGQGVFESFGEMISIVLTLEFLLGLFLGKIIFWNFKKNDP